MGSARTACSLQAPNRVSVSVRSQRPQIVLKREVLLWPLGCKGDNISIFLGPSATLLQHFLITRLCEGSFSFKNTHPFLYENLWRYRSVEWAQPFKVQRWAIMVPQPREVAHTVLRQRAKWWYPSVYLQRDGMPPAVLPFCCLQLWRNIYSMTQLPRFP